MSAPLTRSQKSYLAQLSNRAYNRACALARGQHGDDILSTDDPRITPTDAWRHREVAKACSKLGLRCCSQDDYHLVKAHFQDALGEPGQAMASLIHGQGNPRRVAEFKVIAACKEFGFRLAYAEAICRAKNNGLGLQDVGEKALWQLVYTLRNRGHAHRKTPAPTHSPTPDTANTNT